MNNIVDRLREQAASDEQAGTLYAHELLKEAANEIELLQTELQLAIDALNAQMNQIQLALNVAHSGFATIFTHRSERAKRKKEPA